MYDDKINFKVIKLCSVIHNFGLGRMLNWYHNAHYVDRNDVDDEDDNDDNDATIMATLCDGSE